MEAVAATAAPADEALDARARTGDRAAFRSLYGPQFEGVYDFVLRIAGDRELAADIVRDTFAKAWRAFPEQGSDVAAWLFTTAMSSALDALRYRRDRNGEEREALHFTRVDGDRVPDAAVVFDDEFVELVWDAAVALPREEYSLLALHVRHDLSADEIGEQLGLDGAVSTRLVRTRDAFDEYVTCELVARRGRHNCTELEILLVEDDRSRASQHIRRCARCQESRQRFVSPSEVLGSLAPIAPVRALERDIFGRARRRRAFGIL
jgi:RNA polymerase sigma-70 factor (ECF subfamily)